jgi:hypothetical protein
MSNQAKLDFIESITAPEIKNLKIYSNAQSLAQSLNTTIQGT